MRRCARQYRSSYGEPATSGSLDGPRRKKVHTVLTRRTQSLLHVLGLVEFVEQGGRLTDRKCGWFPRGRSDPRPR